MRVIGVLPLHNNNVTQGPAFLSLSSSCIHPKQSQFTIRDDGANRAFSAIIIYIGGVKDDVVRGILSVASPKYFFQSHSRRYDVVEFGFPTSVPGGFAAGTITRKRSTVFPQAPYTHESTLVFLFGCSGLFATPPVWPCT